MQKEVTFKLVLCYFILEKVMQLYHLFSRNSFPKLKRIFTFFSHSDKASFDRK